MSTGTGFCIEGVPIGNDRPPFVIAEVAQTHDGSLGMAMSFIEIAKECGADAIKFQTHIAEEESTVHEPWRVPFSRQDESRYDYWERISFSEDQWSILKSHADELDIKFLSSPFSRRSCEWLRNLGMRTWKVASGEIFNREYIDWIKVSGDPVILSTGLSDKGDFRSLLSELTDFGLPVALLHCTTQYPTPADQVGMNILQEFKAEFPDVTIGLSDHSGEIIPSIIATYLGAQVIEVHLTLHEKMFGPDVPASLTPTKLSELVKATKFAWEMRQNPIGKDKQLLKLKNERNMFTRSLVPVRDIAAGEVLTEESLGYKKPGGGILYEERHKLIGKTAVTHLEKDRILDVSDVQ